MDRKRLVKFAGAALFVGFVFWAVWDALYRAYDPQGYYARNVGKVAYNSTNNARAGIVIAVTIKFGRWVYVIRDDSDPARRDIALPVDGVTLKDR